MVGSSDLDRDASTRFLPLHCPRNLRSWTNSYGMPLETVHDGSHHTCILMRALVPIGLLAWMAGLFVAHHRMHAGGCQTEARWANQNDEVYDRELEVN